MEVSLQEAVKLLGQGENVVIPTETVYGLAASIKHPEAIRKIFEIKKRPLSNPLIVHVASCEDLDFAQTDLPGFEELAAHFWPGPLSFVLPLVKALDIQITCGLPSVAVRCPSHELCRQLLALTGPLVAPSANPSGKPSPTRLEHVEKDYGSKLMVLDGGPCSHGVESTIIAWDLDQKAWSLARLGSLNPEDIEAVLGYPLERRLKGSVAICPGQQWRHYAPQAHLYLSPHPSLPVIGFEERTYPGVKVYVLGSLHDACGCLENLYDQLRQLDLEDVKEAWVDLDFPENGLWQTLRERLQKAATSS
jgi:L-threonylcarbamoyladenylate synthase